MALKEGERFVVNIIRFGLEGRKDDLCMVARRFARTIRESNPELNVEILKLVVPVKDRRGILRRWGR